jgi:MFS transporter, UMF1 family
MQRKMNNRQERIKKPALIFAWGLYDLANQFFAINIVSLYFILWVTIEKSTPERFYSIFYAASLFLAAISAPVLGAISDVTRKRSIFLTCFTLLAVIFTIMIGLCENVFLGLMFFAIANFGCQGAVIFYNSMMINIAPRDKIGLVSGFGKMMGYAGAIIALYLIKPIVLRHGYQAAFIPTGIMFLAFALPCMLFIKDVDPDKRTSLISFLKKDKISEMFTRLKDVLCDSAKFPGLTNFLKAGFLALCAVQVMIVFMAVYAKRVFGLDEASIVNLIMFSTVFAMAGSMLSGYISDRIGEIRSLMAIFILWGISFILAAFLRQENLFWAIGALVGLSLGSTWVIARAMVIKLVPAERTAELFALFNIVGYVSGATGAIFWGVMLWLLSSLEAAGYRIALFSLNIFLIFGFIFLLRMKKELSNGRKLIR